MKVSSARSFLVAAESPAKPAASAKTSPRQRMPLVKMVAFAE